MKNRLLVIHGPTGVGKSECALSLARTFNGEIVNLDMGQLYTPLSIGTAKPDWRSLDIPHHLFDGIDQPVDCSVMVYRDMVLSVAQKIWKKGALPILVGGSSFYLKSLVFPPAKKVSVAPALTAELQQNYTAITTKDLWKMLAEIDSARAQAIDQNDRYRIMRALTIWFATGAKPSLHAPLYDPVTDDIHIIFLTRDRADLYERINKRVQVMMQQGWLAEVRALDPETWYPFLMRKGLIGYPELIDYSNAAHDQRAYEDLIDRIAQKTRNYAKRQETFWRSFERQCVAQVAMVPEKRVTTQVINLTLSQLDLYINQLQKRFLIEQ